MPRAMHQGSCAMRSTGPTAQIRPLRGAKQARKQGMSGAKGALLEIGIWSSPASVDTGWLGGLQFF
jgi:hypothetical protein